MSDMDDTYRMDEEEMFGHITDKVRRENCISFFRGNQWLDPAGKVALRDMLVERTRTGISNLAAGDPQRHAGACVVAITEMALYAAILYRWAAPDYRNRKTGADMNPPPHERFDVLADYVHAIIRSYGRHIAKWDAIHAGEAGRA